MEPSSQTSTPSPVPGSVPKKRSRSRLIPFAIVAALAVGGFFVYRSLQPAVNPNQIVASGSIEADETVISPKVAGKLAKLFVDEGLDVQRGELLAVLDDTELRAQLLQAQAALSAAQAKLDQATNGNRSQQISEARDQLASAEASYAGALRNSKTSNRNFLRVTDLRLQLDAAQSKLDAANAVYRQTRENLRLIRAGTRPDQLQQAHAELDQARVQLQHAETFYRREMYLLEQGAIAAQQADDARTSRDVAQKAVEESSAHLADLMAGARPEEIRASEMQVLQSKAEFDGAKAALTLAQEAYTDRINAKIQYDTADSNQSVALSQVQSAKAQLSLMLAGSREEEIRSARAMRDQAQKVVLYDQEVVADAKLYAPCDGVVKTKSALPGEQLNPGAGVVTVADLDNIWIRVYVPEDQYGKLRLGEPVDVTVDSFPKEHFKGKILSIASDAEFTPKNAQTPEERVKLVFGVKIKVENPHRKLKPGMPGDATIQVG